MSALKIVFLDGKKQIVLYGQGMTELWQVESHLLERIDPKIRVRPETVRFRKFWIDEEGDHVEIMNDVDFQFFLKGGGPNKTPKIYFEHQNQQENQSEQLQQGSASSGQKGVEVALSVHSNVGCDECNVVPIRGHRYKCLQCPNFDLCMKCEGAMRHSDHIMLRIPSPEATNCEPLGTIASFLGSKYCQRKCAKAASAAAGNEGKSRHHRHQRRHGNSGAGIWSNFYGMMQDLTEGGSIPVSPVNTETPTKQAQQTQASSSDSAAAPTSHSKETNTSPERNSKTTEVQNAPRSSESAPQSYEHVQNYMDPQSMKTGIQILSNFSEMFEKILDPAMSADVSRSSSGPGSVVSENDLTKSQSDASTSESNTGITNQIAASKEITPDPLQSVTPMETEVPESSATSSIPAIQPRSLDLDSVENDWTMIDDKICPSNPAAAAAKIVASSPPFDYSKLSQQVRTHIENEMLDSTTFVTPKEVPSPNIPSPQIVSETPVVAPVAAAPELKIADSTERRASDSETPAIVDPVAAAPVLTIPGSTERRAFAPEIPVIAPALATPVTAERRAFPIYHPDARINSSVHAMMAMGFSNEGAMLTQLLESVNGSIPLALDMMSAAQRS